MFKYLFKALLKDGSLIEQTQEDKSLIAEGKNAFYDVLQNMENVRAFSLYNQETGAEHLVDLLDGRFEVNGCSFYLHDEEGLEDIRLIYFRRNLVMANIVTSEVAQGVKSYHFGFQARHKGQNLQRVMVVN